MPDGRVAFLDFGMTKQLDQDQIELEIAALEAVFDDDPEGLRVALHDLGFLNDPRKVDAELLMEHVRAVGGWYMEDREVTIDSGRVMEAIAAVSDPRSSFYRLMRRENLPANELMGRRMESGVLAVLGQLNATRNWNRIGREWWFGGPPARPPSSASRERGEGPGRASARLHRHVDHDQQQDRTSTELTSSIRLMPPGRLRPHAVGADGRVDPPGLARVEGRSRPGRLKIQPRKPSAIQRSP